jgi:YbbR domain-containing protein
VNNRQETKGKKTLGLKILSLVMAVLLWLYIISQQDMTAPTNFVTANLHYYNLGEGLTVIGPDTVSVRVWGNYNEKEPVVAYVDLAGMKAGAYELPVKIDPIRGALIATVEPDKVEVILHAIAKKEMAVNCNVLKTPANGFELLDILVEPEKCIIKGDQEAVDRVNTVSCQVDLQNITSTTSFSVPLIPRDRAGEEVQGIRIIPESATIYAVINKKTSRKNVQIVPVTLENLPAGYKLGEITTEPEQVLVIGTTGQLDPITQLRTMPISLENRIESFSFSADLEIPDGVRTVPRMVQVHITIEKDNEEVLSG